MKKKKNLKPSHLLLQKNRQGHAGSLALRLFHAGRVEEAALESAAALKKTPRDPEALYVQGVVRWQRGELLPAKELLRLALAARPEFAEAYFALGCLNNDAGSPAEAVPAFEYALALGLRSAALLSDLGYSLDCLGHWERAIAHYQEALRLEPHYLSAHYNLGMVLGRRGRLAEAGDCYLKALAIDPGYFMAMDNLGFVYEALGELEKAETLYRRSLGINDRNPVAYNNLANVLKKRGLYREAEACCRKALAVNPQFAPAHNNLSTIYYSLGMVEEAIVCGRQSLLCAPDPAVHSNLLLLLHYPAAVSQAEIFAESLRWSALYETDRAAGSRPPANGHQEGRCLRVGYLSADFCDHSVAYFIEPLLCRHNREKIEVFCYANVINEDEVTARLRGLADHWQDITVLDDPQAAAKIRADGIDILVDLGGHTGGNRLPLFALRSAPLQLTWLGYPNTTGLRSMDYRLTDMLADPPGGQDDQLSSESLLRLEGGFLCYQPEAATPPVGPLPLFEQKRTTFGCFNNLAKITPEAVVLWAEIMLAVPGSRLVLKNLALANPETAARYVKMFEATGVVGERVELLGNLPAKADHLALYGKIDLALDTFPYNGTTTTCEALWMGVPVVTLRGERHSGRVGASIMHQLALDELVADSLPGYFDLAVSLAKDPQRLAVLRAGMRRRLQDSSLLDDQRFAAALEEVYRRIWATWCESAA